MTGVTDLERLGILERDVPLGPLTTYKSGGPARYLTRVEDEESLRLVVESGLATEMPVLVLGRGSNLVVADEGFAGLVVQLGSGFNRVAVDGTRVEAGGVVPLPRLARATVEAGLTGLEFFVGVPGSVGGAVRQNAGCFGTETKDRLQTADLISLATGQTRSATPGQLELAYRHSNVAPNEVVVSAVFATSPGDKAWGKAEMRRITSWRRDNQPGGTLNAGSVFKNPPHTSAGELIDSLGLKGTRVGDVAVSEKHANFFVAGPNASSAEIAALVDLVKNRVFELSGIKLEPEIQFVGFEQWT